MIDILARAISPQVGVVASLNEARPTTLFGGGLNMFSAQSGDLETLHPELRFDARGAAPLTAIGSACSQDPETARRRAVYEALERHAAAVYDPSEVLTASAIELGSDALPWTILPELHVRGAADQWTTTRLDHKAPIRWVRGFDLVGKREIYVPLVMAHIYVWPGDGESFWPQSTAGVAAHRSLEQALAGAILELVERDAVETVWMLRLPLPQIEVEGVRPELDRLAATDDAGFVDQRYYDATRDLGIPTIYAVRTLAPPVGHDIIVSCASDATFAEAAFRARLEAGGQQLMRLHECRGAAYCRFPGDEGWPISDAIAQRPDFSFLDSAQPPERAGERAASGVDQIGWELRTLVAHLAPSHPHIVALNLSTSESLALGIHVARVIVPTLAAVSPTPDQRFLRHRRLAEVARHFGLPAPTADGLNPMPQPFS